MRLADAMQTDMLRPQRDGGHGRVDCAGPPTPLPAEIGSMPTPSPAPERPLRRGTSARPRRPPRVDGLVPPLLSLVAPVPFGNCPSRGCGCSRSRPGGLAVVRRHRAAPTGDGVRDRRDDGRPAGRPRARPDRRRTAQVQTEARFPAAQRRQPAARRRAGRWTATSATGWSPALARRGPATESNDKLRIRFTLEVDGKPTFTTVVTTPPTSSSSARSRWATTCG